MSVELRRVPADWEHPPSSNCGCKPLRDDLIADQMHWDEGKAQWDAGFVEVFNGPLEHNWAPKPEHLNSDDFDFTDWVGDRPSQDDYMPDWTAEERTHYQMYEVVTEGTPISPVFDTPEALAGWLTANTPDLMLYQGLPYEEWLRVIKQANE